jgi:hypothetical protein
MKKILSISIIVFWGLFLWLDKLWNEVIAEAVVKKMATYGELFGPLSFFRPAILYLALALTLCLTIVNMKRK